MNGKVKFVPGTLGTPPIITVNQLPAQLDTIISDQDAIFIELGLPGEEPNVLVQDLVDEMGTLDVSIDGVFYSLPPITKRNGRHCTLTEVVNDRDKLEIRLPQTVEEVLRLTNHEDKLKTTEFVFEVNGNPRKIIFDGFTVFIHNKRVSLTDPVHQGDSLMLVPTPIERPTVRSVVGDEITQPSSITVTFNGELLSIPISQTEIFLNGERSSWDQSLENGDELEVKVENPIQPLFHDVFRYSSTPLIKPDGAIKMGMFINGDQADFQTELHDGDNLELIWEYETI